MSEWVLAPVKPTEAMSYATGSGHAYDPSDDWTDMLAARPAIPRAVWDAMVERGARAVVRSHFDGIEVTARYVETQVDRDWRAFCGVVNDTLRAALGNPRVEGDKT